MARIVDTSSGGSAGMPFGSVCEAVAEVDGIEEELLFEGTATEFRLAGRTPTDYSPDGHWEAEPSRTQPFRSRMLVLRPNDPSRFNGTVIATWNNVSFGQDRFAGAKQAAQLVGDGFALVGVTAERTGVEGLSDDTPTVRPDGRPVERPPGLRAHDPERYGTLEHPGDGFSYDIFTQAAVLLGRDRRTDGNVDPLAGFDVDHVVAMGVSQSAQRLATYVNAVQPLAGALDAFLLIVYAGNPCALDPASAPNLPGAGRNVVELLGWRTHRIRDDVRVPTIVLNSEFEVGLGYPTAGADTDHLRWWEVAGTAHGGASRRDDDVLVGARPNANVVSFAPASRAALHALRRWLTTGEAPPHQPRLQQVGEPPMLPRDEHGNAIGGIRWPDVEAPLATHVGEMGPENLSGLGSSTAFPPEKIRALYGDRAIWLAKYEEATERLVDGGVLLADDATQMVARAAALDFPG